MLELVILTGLLTAVAFVIVMHKLDIRKFAGYSAHSDVLISGLMAMIFLGTFAGILTGVIAGIFVSLYLVFAKYVFGARRYKLGKGWYNSEVDK